jgi:hypothetical protein
MLVKTYGDGPVVGQFEAAHNKQTAALLGQRYQPQARRNIELPRGFA